MRFIIICFCREIHYKIKFYFLKVFVYLMINFQLTSEIESLILGEKEKLSETAQIATYSIEWILKIYIIYLDPI